MGTIKKDLLLFDDVTINATAEEFSVDIPLSLYTLNGYFTVDMVLAGSAPDLEIQPVGKSVSSGLYDPSLFW